MNLPVPWDQAARESQDLGIVLQAYGMEDLFERAAAGMFSFITELSEVRCAQTDYCVVEADNVVELLGRWLKELNRRHHRLHEVYSEFHVEHLSRNRLSAIVRGEKINPLRHIIYGEIKAIPMDLIQVRQARDKWEAEIVFQI